MSAIFSKERKSLLRLKNETLAKEFEVSNDYPVFKGSLYRFGTTIVEATRDTDIQSLKAEHMLPPQVKMYVCSFYHRYILSTRTGENNQFFNSENTKFIRL